MIIVESHSKDTTIITELAEGGVYKTTTYERINGATYYKEPLKSPSFATDLRWALRNHCETIETEVWV